MQRREEPRPVSHGDLQDVRRGESAHGEAHRSCGLPEAGLSHRRRFGAEGSHHRKRGALLPPEGPAQGCEGGAMSPRAVALTEVLLSFKAAFR